MDSTLFDNVANSIIAATVTKREAALKAEGWDVRIFSVPRITCMAYAGGENPNWHLWHERMVQYVSDRYNPRNKTFIILHGSLDGLPAFAIDAMFQACHTLTSVSGVGYIGVMPECTTLGETEAYTSRHGLSLTRWKD